MTNDTQATETSSIAFGAKLQSAREALGLGTKDAAARLRLNEKVIIMMEKERYADDLPITFIRGYIRSYSKLLQIPEYEVKKALDPIKPKPTSADIELAKNISKPAQSVSTENFTMQISTYLIAFMVIGLVGAWLYTHNFAKETRATVAAENQFLPVPNETIQPTLPTLAPSAPHLNTTPNNVSIAPNANAPTLPATQINAIPPTDQTSTPESKLSTPDVSDAKPVTKQKPRTAPAEEDDEQYVDDENTD